MFVWRFPCVVSSNSIHSAYGLTWSMLLYLLSQKIHPYKYNTFGCLLWNIFRMLHKLLLTNFYYAKLLATFSFKLQIILEEHISLQKYVIDIKLLNFSHIMVCSADVTQQILEWSLTTVLDQISILNNCFYIFKIFCHLMFFTL